jgi:hypothetical protein
MTDSGPLGAKLHRLAQHVRERIADGSPLTALEMQRLAEEIAAARDIAFEMERHLIPSTARLDFEPFGNVVPMLKPWRGDA